jgi:hypothetical protein
MAFFIDCCQEHNPAGPVVIRNSIFSVNEGIADNGVLRPIYALLCRHYPDFRHEEIFIGYVSGS